MMAATPSRHPFSTPLHDHEFQQLRHAIMAHHESDPRHNNRRLYIYITQRLLARVDALQTSMGRVARAKAAAATLRSMAGDTGLPTTTTPHSTSLPALCLALVFPSHTQQAPHVRAPLLQAVMDAVACAHVRALAQQELDLLGRCEKSQDHKQNTKAPRGVVQLDGLRARLAQALLRVVLPTSQHGLDLGHDGHVDDPTKLRISIKQTPIHR